jgi:hypothetical protein
MLSTVLSKPTTSTNCFCYMPLPQIHTYLFSNKVDSDHGDKFPHSDVVHSSTGGYKEEDKHDPDQCNKVGCTCAFHMTVSRRVAASNNIYKKLRSSKVMWYYF